MSSDGPVTGALTDAPSCTRMPDVSCSECRLRGLCLPHSLDAAETAALDAIVARHRPKHAGDYIYRAHDPFVHLYIVRSGAVKTLTVTEAGREQVTGLYLPGEMFGIDGLSTNFYTGSAIALDTSTICELPFDEYEELSQQIPKLQTHAFEVMSRKIVEQQVLMAQLNRAASNATQRVAGFLLSLALRNRRVGLSPYSFKLPLTRRDIGSMVGLTVETVSRTLREFDRQGCCRISGRQVEDLDLGALEQFAVHD